MFKYLSPYFLKVLKIHIYNYFRSINYYFIELFLTFQHIVVPGRVDNKTLLKCIVKRSNSKYACSTTPTSINYNILEHVHLSKFIVSCCQHYHTPFCTIFHSVLFFFHFHIIKYLHEWGNRTEFLSSHYYSNIQ